MKQQLDLDPDIANQLEMLAKKHIVTRKRMSTTKMRFDV